MTGLPDGLATRNLRQAHSEATCLPNSSGYCNCPLESAPLETCDVVCSDVGDGRHKPLIDLDLPVKLVPSGTPGHSHLYIDKAVTFDRYVAILKALADAGIVQWGFHDATRERGYGSLRHPDRPKEATR